jgi:pimeloyl-ACP methyl ester carboxylesterase
MGTLPLAYGTGPGARPERSQARRVEAVFAGEVRDKFFPAEHARRLAAILPDARVELVPGSRTWIMRDQPERTAALIAELARRATAQQAA